MIISHKYRFIFIKTMKTAGTSIEVFLSTQCGKDDIVTPIFPHEEPHMPRNYAGYFNPFCEIITTHGHGIKSTIKEFIKKRKFYNHISALKVKSRISGEVWNNYFKFCVERNPFEKTLSHFSSYNRRLGGHLTFDQYLENKYFCLNYPLYCDTKNRSIVDRIIKYENLNKELAETFNMLNIPFEGFTHVKAKSNYRTDRRPYREVYTETQKEIIKNAFDVELKMHEYRF